MKVKSQTLTITSISLQDILGLNDRRVRCHEFQICGAGAERTLLSYNNVDFVQLSHTSLVPVILPCDRLSNTWLKALENTVLIHLIVDI